MVYFLNYLINIVFGFAQAFGYYFLCQPLRPELANSARMRLSSLGGPVRATVRILASLLQRGPFPFAHDWGVGREQLENFGGWDTQSTGDGPDWQPATVNQFPGRLRERRRLGCRSSGGCRNGLPDMLLSRHAVGIRLQYRYDLLDTAVETTGNLRNGEAVSKGFPD